MPDWTKNQERTALRPHVMKHFSISQAKNAKLGKLLAGMVNNPAFYGSAIRSASQDSTKGSIC